MKKNRDIHLSKLRLWGFTATLDQRAKFSAVVFGLLIYIVTITPLLIHSTDGKSPNSFWHLFIGLMIAVTMGLIFYAFIKRPLRAADAKRDEILGRAPTATESKDFYIWYKYGVKPTDPAIQPLLPKYLDYLKLRLDGTYSDTYTTSKRNRRFTLIVAIFLLAGSTISLFDKHPSAFTVIFGFVYGGGLLLTYFRKPSSKPRKFFSKLNAKRLAKVAAMRHQLA